MCESGIVAEKKTNRNQKSDDCRTQDGERSRNNGSQACRMKEEKEKKRGHRMILSEMPASPMFSLARDATVYTTPRQSTSLLALARSLRLTISDYFSKASSATIFDLASTPNTRSPRAQRAACFSQSQFSVPSDLFLSTTGHWQSASGGQWGSRRRVRPQVGWIRFCDHV